MKRNLVLLILFFFTFPFPGPSQTSSTHELHFEVNRIHPYISITKEKLKDAQTIIDLDRHYKPSWVKEYVSIEVLATNSGKIRKALGKDATLTQEQKDIMKKSDAGTEISVIVRYLPDNNLTYNDIKVHDFYFTVHPEKEAAYPGGKQQLMQYIKENAIAKIPDDTFEGYDLTTIKFTINEAGEISNAHVFWPTDEKTEIEALLLETIQKMPCWTPATYSDGTKVSQEFALTVGNMENCVVNLLNIR